ncbi:hypothetical protein I4U23_026584 [Adineta vaga]|nr:hypothetical protein I4U23_026584 [Adineta vaga]
MYSDDEIDGCKNNRNTSAFKLERFLDRSHFYLERLPIVKIELKNINHIDQSDLYIEKLNEINKLVHDLADSIRNIEELQSQLDENERLTLDHQIYRLRNETDREMNEFHRLREQFSLSSLPIDESTSSYTEENDLRQRHTTINRVNNSYDLLEQDLATLRETIDEVATLVNQQEEIITRTQQLRNIAQVRVHNVSSFFHKAIHNRYLTIASGALLGASLGGPVGFMMGVKVGSLVALTGSAVGAFSMDIMRQRIEENNKSQNTATAYNQAML